MPDPITPRPIRTIAQEIRRIWRPVWFGAEPYLNAMFALNSINDAYGADSGKSVVLYFLANAAQFKGPEARRIKAELRAALKQAK